MFDILSKRHAATLESFASSNVLVALDYDGTLAPLVSNRAKATMRPRTRRLLTAVARQYPTAVISGRARADLIRCIGPVPVRHFTGNHGLEPWGATRARAALVERWAGSLAGGLPELPGLFLENKRYSLTVHFRAVRDRRHARQAILSAIAPLRGARIIAGGCAISLVPRGAPHKGDALERVRKRLRCDRLIYVGDDRTDEDAFSSASASRLLAIRVGRLSTSAARYYIADQRAIDRLLQALAALRS
jgi:trehalose 6-phosphate phosphatase